MNNTSRDIERQLQRVLAQLLVELRPSFDQGHVNSEAKFDKDLGMDSLTRMEFFHRAEKILGVQIDPTVMVGSNTLGEVLTALSTTVDPVRKAPSVQLSYQPMTASVVEATLANNLVEVLYSHAQQEPNRPHVFLQDDFGDEAAITYGQLWEQSLKVAHALKALGVRQHQTVAMMLPTSLDFFVSFFGILLLGAIPVPIYPPARIAQLEEYALREVSILDNAETRVLITFGKAKRLSQLLRTLIPSLVTVTTLQNLIKGAESAAFQYDAELCKATNPALIQYTSGSTGTPKGVVLTHANLLANIRAYGKAVEVKSTDSVVSWLPLYHDMGLIGSWLGSFYHGVPVTIMSPLAFLARPERWLWAIHNRRATISGGPNFAFELCVSKIDETKIEGLDLSSWRVAFNGAEAVIPRTLERFAERFSQYGLRQETLCPVYGLAEASVGLTVSDIHAAPLIDTILKDPFEKSGKAIPAEEEAQETQQFVNCGKVLPGHEIRVLNDEGALLTERDVGNIEFRGPSAMQGYYRNKMASDAAFHEGWVRTGDRGYLAGGNLFITGRKKDLIIKSGRNFYPEGIERSAAMVEGVRQGCVAAFSVVDSKSASEQLVVVAETHAKRSTEKEKIRRDINEKISTTIGVEPDRIELVPPRTIPKTSSGKLQRSACKEMYLSSKLNEAPSSLSIQLARLLSMGLWSTFSQKCCLLGRVVYTGYFALVFLLTIPFIGCAILLPPRKVARRFTKFLANLLLRVAFCSLSVTRPKNQIKADVGQVIYAANHSSYLDAIVLIAALPSDVVIIGKGELQSMPMVKSFMSKLGHFTVEREEVSQSLQDVEVLKDILDHHSIAIFPEGTFHYEPGLRPFKMGAFKLAVDKQKGITPVSIRGTRRFMRSDKFLLRPLRICVTVGDTVLPKGSDWEEVVRLQNQVRKEILKHIDEQAINW